MYKFIFSATTRIHSYKTVQYKTRQRTHSTHILSVATSGGERKSNTNSLVVFMEGEQDTDGFHGDRERKEARRTRRALKSWRKRVKTIFYLKNLALCVNVTADTRRKVRCATLGLFRHALWCPSASSIAPLQTHLRLV